MSAIAGGRVWWRAGGRRGHSDEHFGGQRRSSRQPFVALGGIGLQQRALEELAHDPERESPLEFRRSCAEDPDAVIRGPHACLLEQPRLAHPGGPLDHQGSPNPPPRGAERGVDALQLVLALKQRGRLSEGGLIHAD